MSELYCRNNFCVAAGRFLSVGEDNENEIILTFTDDTRNVTRACFKKTASGNLKRNKAYKSHILTKKTTKRKRNLRKATMTDATNVKNMKKILPYL